MRRLGPPAKILNWHILDTSVWVSWLLFSTVTNTLNLLYCLNRTGSILLVTPSILLRVEVPAKSLIEAWDSALIGRSHLSVFLKSIWWKESGGHSLQALGITCRDDWWPSVCYPDLMTPVTNCSDYCSHTVVKTSPDLFNSIVSYFDMASLPEILTIRSKFCFAVITVRIKTYSS